MTEGYLVVNVYSGSIANPVKNATVTISKNGKNIASAVTNEDGKTETIALETVSKAYSEEEQYDVRPYETYDILVTALGLTKTIVEGVQIFDGITSFQNVYLTSIDENINEEIQEVTPNTLWGDYPPYIKNEQEDKMQDEATPYVLNKVIVPETIIVHDGIPSNTNAPNYTVPFTDYIKNVASSEIYSTWPEETIKANILAIISFTLNRIFTEWYISQGYDFTITSTTSYDQKYTKNGTIFEPISNMVDEIFSNYLRGEFRIEPLLAHYKSNTSEPGYLSQWGSKTLGELGYDALEIVRTYYGKTIDIYEAEVVGKYPFSFTSTLKQGDCSNDVYILQNVINYIRGSYPGIPMIKNPSGKFNEDTTASVRKFQSVFNLPVTGSVDSKTWYRMSRIFTAVTDMTNSIYK